jgi:flavin-dependent dehydrogenase
MIAEPSVKTQSTVQLDVLVLGEHPAAYFAALLLHVGGKLRVVHCTIPDQSPVDRLVILNPAFFSLHPMLEGLKRKLDLVSIYGLQFLSDDPAVRSEHRSKSMLAYVASYKAVRAAIAKLAGTLGLEMIAARTLEIHRLDETGVDITMNKSSVRAKVLVVAGELTDAQQKTLGLPESWGADVVHRYSFLKLPGAKSVDLGGRPTVPMSLNLKETLCWGWLLPGPKSAQLAVSQPVEMLDRMAPADLLEHWIGVLRSSGLLKTKGKLPLENIEWIDVPLAGALAHEGVANRTLLIGPAGGFYSACTEDIYPNAWSALFAADAIRKALKEVHLQDALQPYRSKWRTTLGEYLRGPQQNFRFLLPLVYRNEVMTTRLTESILLGKSVVR